MERPLVPDRRELGGRLIVAGAVLGSWIWHDTLLGPLFDGDTAIPAAMALRPLAATSLYFWGGSRIGMLIPLVTRGLHLAFGLPAEATVQLLVYLASALGLFLALGLIERWPPRLALALFFAWPSFTLVQALCSPASYVPLSFAFAMGELHAFRAAARDATPLRVAWVALLAGCLLWSADSSVLFLPPQIWVVGLALWRGRARLSWKPVAAAVGGAALPAVLVAVGKRAVSSAGLWRLVAPAQGLLVTASLAPQLGELAPALGGYGVYVLVVLAFGWATVELWSLRRGGLPNVSALALLGTAPLLGLFAAGFSRHFEMNLRLPRYLAGSVLFGVVAGCLIADRLLARAHRTAPTHWVAWAATVAVGILAWLGRFPGHGPELEAQWQHKLQLVEDSGCRAVLGNHWDVYPLMALSEGTVLATPVGPAPGVVEGSLAREAVRQPEVCRYRSRLPDPGPCQPAETYFGTKLLLRDEVRRRIDGEDLDLCRYQQAPFVDRCARAADLPTTGGPADASVRSAADGASSNVLELRQAVRFGPYLSVPAGAYRYVTRISLAAPMAAGAALKLDAYSGELHRFLAERRLNAEELPPVGEWRIFSVPVTVPALGVGDLELRASASGGGTFREDWIGLFKADGGPPEGGDLRDPPCASGAEP